MLQAVQQLLDFILRQNTSQGGDPVNSCNVSETFPATVTFDVPSGVTANPPSLEFTDCSQANQTKYVTFSSSIANDYDISILSVTGGKTGGAWDTAPAAFELDVNAPADATPPVISYTLNPASPNGSNGWYKSNVTLTWVVSE